MDCKVCGKPIYGTNAVGICKYCIRRMSDDELIRILREYLDFDKALVEQVIRDTGISYSRIMKLVQDDRLILTDNDMLVDLLMHKKKTSLENVAVEMKKRIESKEDSGIHVHVPYDSSSKLVKDIEKKKAEK